MLMQLSITHFATIEKLTVSFKDGFNVLTGETGAGKSIIIDALGMLIGGRASADYVRHGAEKAVMEAIFDVGTEHPANRVLEEFGLEASEDGLLLIRREITSGGKSVARINGGLANLTMLKTLGQQLVNIHGQHEHQELTQSDKHREQLDAFGGAEGKKLLEEYRVYYREYTSLHKQLYDLEQNEQGE